MGLAALALVTLGANAAEPYHPARDSEVLYTAPTALRADRDAIAAARRAWLTDPSDVGLAYAVAADNLRLGKSSGDPRFFGYARAALGPWWDQPDAPPAVLALRAKLKETDHDYAGALADLGLLLEQKPQDVQAWIEVANLRRVRGDYAASAAAGDRLAEFVQGVPVTLARVPLWALTGKAEQAYEELTALRPEAEENILSAVLWIISMQAEIANALGRDETAERYFKEGLVLIPDSGYLRRSYADFLLDPGRADEVLAQVQGHLADTGSLLRAAIAARRLGQTSQASAWQSELATRFAEIRLRGGEPHGRFEARYALELRDDPQEALIVALANWQKQRELRDTRNVLEAALAADNPAAAAPVRDFLEQHHTQDVQLQRLLKALAGER